MNGRLGPRALARAVVIGRCLPVEVAAEWHLSTRPELPVFQHGPIVTCW